MAEKSWNVVLGGEAGQGLVTIGQLLSACLVRSGYEIVVTQDYQSRIRGGHNTYAVRVSPEGIAAPAEAVDLLVALNAETVALHRGELMPEGLIVADKGLGAEGDRVVGVPFSELAPGRYANVVALGVVGALLGLEPDLIARRVDEFFGRKHPEAAAQNQEAVRKAYEWCAGRCPAHLRLPPVTQPEPRLMMNGNEALALGALAAGVRFCAFYPMTPSTSIALTLAAQAEKMGLVVEQAEDEIAAINMALGASFAGAPSLVSTSGGGFALMVEGVSLAAMTETPLVIILAQRPGPATGLPTRTEQADLEFVLHAGHGEFPRAVFAPGSVEECFHLTHRAFHLAERYQGPVFVLTDQFLADSYRAVAPFDLEALRPVRPQAAAESVAAPYQRYALTEDGLSPRLLPGRSKHLVVADSDEHTEDGHLTEDLGLRKLMVEKRLQKGKGLAAEALGPSYWGDERPDLLLVCWGSSRGAVGETAARLRARGDKVGVLHFSQVWPLAGEKFLDRLEQAGRVVAVEGNATGQLARLIRRETGFAFPEQIGRYDGLPLTPEWVLRQIQE